MPAANTDVFAPSVPAKDLDSPTVSSLHLSQFSFYYYMIFFRISTGISSCKCIQLQGFFGTIDFPLFYSRCFPLCRILPEKRRNTGICGKRGSGMICLNGAAARCVSTGDKIIIMAYAGYEPEEARTHKPAVVFVDEENKISRVTNYEKHGLLKDMA